MNHWWKKAFLNKALLIFTFVWVSLGIQETKGSDRATATDEIAVPRRAEIMFGTTLLLDQKFTEQNTNIDSNFDSPLLLVQNPPVCQEVSSEYQQIYAFETASFYINICQLEQNYFYYRQSKSNSGDALLIPARIVFGGAVFEAVDGKTTYFVGTDYNGYYSSVMRNNDEIIVEPEINSSSNALQREDKSQPSSSLSNVNAESYKNTNAKPQMCIQNKLSSNPLVYNRHFGDRFIQHQNANVTIARDFSYDNSPFASTLAQKTSSATAINYKIAPKSKTVSQFCLNSIAEGELEEVKEGN